MSTSVLRPRSRQSEPDDEQLLKLFRNRAELKKETARIRHERDILAAKVRNQEAANLRAQQRLDQLEGMLADPDQAASVAVYYQLRGIWQHCRRRLAHLAHDLKVHQAEVEFQAQSSRFRSGILSEITALERPLAHAESRLREIQAEAEVVLAEHAQARGLWHMMRRRRLGARLDSLLEEQQAARSEIKKRRQAIRERDSQPDPTFEGLSLEGKRKINLAVIALAQELCLHFNVKDIAAAARDATVLSLSSVRYGDPDACRRLGIRIQQVFEQLQDAEELPHRVQRRSRLIARTVEYTRPGDTVPAAASVAVIPPEVTDEGRAVPGDSLTLNVLTEGYWDIQRALID